MGASGELIRFFGGGCYREALKRFQWKGNINTFYISSRDHVALYKLQMRFQAHSAVTWRPCRSCLHTGSERQQVYAVNSGSKNDFSVQLHKI